MSRLALCAWLMCWSLAQATPVPSDQAQRDHIRQQRQEVEARHRQSEEACRQQFVVTPCLEKARADKQDALRGLRSQEVALDDAQRHRRSLEQAKRTARKAKDVELPRPSPKAEKGPRPSQPKQKQRPSMAASEPDRGAEEKRHRERYEQRQREIQVHREEVEKRNAARSIRKAPQPLPVPASGMGQ